MTQIGISMKIITATIFAILFWAFSAQAHGGGEIKADYSPFPEKTAAQLKSECEHISIPNPTTDDIKNSYRCLGYIQAISESDRPPNCPIPSIAKEIEAFLRWASEHPESSSASAYYAVTQSAGNLLADCPQPLNDMPPPPLEKN